MILRKFKEVTVFSVSSSEESASGEKKTSHPLLVLKSAYSLKMSMGGAEKLFIFSNR
jgi:hypothetical protein